MMPCHHDSCIFPSSNLDEELCNIMDRRCRAAITLLMSTLAEAWRKARSAWRICSSDLTGVDKNRSPEYHLNDFKGGAQIMSVYLITST